MKMDKSANSQVKYAQEPIKNWFTLSILSQFTNKDKNEKTNQRQNLNKGMYVTNFDINVVSPTSW